MWCVCLGVHMVCGVCVDVRTGVWCVYVRHVVGKWVYMWCAVCAWVHVRYVVCAWMHVWFVVGVWVDARYGVCVDLGYCTTVVT